MIRRAGAGAAAAAATALFAGGCAVGPDYRRPEAPVPAAFKEQVPAESQAAAPERWKPAEPKDEAARGRWREIFGGRPPKAAVGWVRFCRPCPSRTRSFSAPSRG